MPVPKHKQEAYGVIVGKNINSGKDLDESKDIADRAMKHINRGEARSMSKKYGNGKGKNKKGKR
jgi:hypothetical protein